MEHFQKIKELLIKIPKDIWMEIIIRIFLIVVFMLLGIISPVPFVRIIQPEEVWLYKYPNRNSVFVSSQALSWLLILSCLSVAMISYGIHRDVKQAVIALLVPTLAIPITGILTAILKIAVGRPRPDFFNRCYGEGYLTVTDFRKPCTQNVHDVNKGRLSFPSVSFCVLGFVSIYLSSNLGTFAKNGRGFSWKFLVTALPLIAATLVAISRTCDYRHHWQDVFAGSILGLVITYIVYRQYFPSPVSPDCNIPYPFFEDNDDKLADQ